MTKTLTPNPDARRRCQLPLPDACKDKWNEGRAHYGLTWAGDHPLIELHEELVDSLNYLQTPEVQGKVGHQIAEAWFQLLYSIAESVRLHLPAIDPHLVGAVGSDNLDKMLRPR